MTTQNKLSDDETFELRVEQFKRMILKKWAITPQLQSERGGYAYAEAKRRAELVIARRMA